jgi:hypothetical protein
MRGARLWFRAIVCGQTVPVYLCKPGNVYLLEEEDEKLLGVFDHDKNRIAVCSEQPVESIKETLVHELLHAYFYLSRVRSNFLRDNLELEEKIVGTLAPHLFAGLRDSGLLRIPRLPKI